MRYAVALAVILLIPMTPWGALSEDIPDLAAVRTMLESGQSPVRIVCLGDSVTGVYYHTGGRRAWPDMLGVALAKIYPQAKIEVVNAGVSGNTTGDALARIERDVLSRRPNVVAVMFGLNDIVRGDRRSFCDNLDSIVRRCREAGAVVVLCTPNSVYPVHSTYPARTWQASSPRPPAVVGEFSRMVREAAQNNSAPLADCHGAFEAVRRGDPTEWMLLMSETIHPNMNGHKRIAETVAETISGKAVSLGETPPLDDSLRMTSKRLEAGLPLKVIAMPPYDGIVREALGELFPDARIDVTAWPIEGQSLADIVEWSRGIRDRKPDLVALAVPADARTDDDECFIRDYSHILSWCMMSDSDHAWDVVPILPGVAGPVADDQLRRAEWARRIIAGYDVESIERKGDDPRPSRQILLEWFRQKLGK